MTNGVKDERFDLHAETPTLMCYVFNLKHPKLFI